MYVSVTWTLISIEIIALVQGNNGNIAQTHAVNAPFQNKEAMVARKSKRKPRKSFLDEDDSEENSKSTTEKDFGGKEGEVENGGVDGSGDKDEGGAQQGEILLPRWQAELEQIACRVNWGAGGDGSNLLTKPNIEETSESIAGGEEACNKSHDEMMKFEVREETALNLEMSVLKKDASEEKEPMPPLMEKNKVSTGAAALLEAVAKKCNSSCGCSEPFLEDEEKCKANCANRKARRECNLGCSEIQLFQK